MHLKKLRRCAGGLLTPRLAKSPAKTMWPGGFQAMVHFRRSIRALLKASAVVPGHWPVLLGQERALLQKNLTSIGGEGMKEFRAPVWFSLLGHNNSTKNHYT